jgi:tRNA A-37 threonylcarbamoyl transferase component Bud32
MQSRRRADKIQIVPEDLQRALADLPRIGTLVKDRGYRQVWRFEYEGKAYYLKFYPRRGSRLKRILRGNPAMREFLRLQSLQKAKIPSPRASAVLVGFRLNGEVGDAVINHAIEPSVQLDHYLSDLHLRGERAEKHRAIAQRVQSLVQQLGAAKLGHSDLHLGNMLLRDDEVHLLDGYAVRPGGLKLNDILLLAHSVSRFATRTDLLRGWRELMHNAHMPATNRVRGRQWRKMLEASTRENRYFGRATIGEWSGVFTKHTKFPRRWSPFSQIDVSADEWRREWPVLLGKIESDQLEVIKRSPSGDVLRGDVIIAGRPVKIIVKRARKRYWYRYFNEIGRGSRARRGWKNAWRLIARDLPTAWPVMFMEKRVLGYASDAIMIFEHVEGTNLAAMDLDALPADARDTMFRRLGRTLRRAEESGLTQYDAKMSNWIIRDDEKMGPVPIIIDVDGIRRFIPTTWGVLRLLRSLREHAQYTPDDSLALCQGYAPHARLQREEPAQPEPAVETL